jgi:uncharacterized RDD family membrane protein YckC
MTKKKNPFSLWLALTLLGLIAYVPEGGATSTPPDTVVTSADAASPPPATATPEPVAKEKNKKADKKHSVEVTIKAGDDDEKDTEEPADEKESSDNAIVSIGHDSTLAAGGHAAAVVSVLGSSTSAGDVDEAVVSVLGNTHVTGRVGDSAVAVLGNTYVDGPVGESVVAVFGNVELGPHAEVHGDVVAVGGDLVRDPAAIIHGTTQEVTLFGHMGDYAWLHTWVHNCLMYGRPLAFVSGLGWAWGIAVSFLVLYLLLALLFPTAVNQCVRTMEANPGRTTLAALFTFIGKPIVFLLLVITVIGSILIPFLGFALFVAGLFGKSVALAWFGRRALPAREPGHEYPPVLAVLVGGVIALMLYVVPVLGFITYKALDVLGLGMVIYTLLLAFRARRTASTVPPAATLADTAAPAAAAATAGADIPAAEVKAAPAPAVSLQHANRAGFWIRMVALLLDLILVAIVCGILSIPTHRGLLLILASYGAVMWKLKGTTIGGIVCGLRVVRLDGRAIDWPTAIVRALGSFLSAALAGLGFIWVVFDPERQSWHDKIAGTVVVHTPRSTPLI